MDSLITQIIAWPTLLVSLLMFGFAPGAVLRIIVLAFRRDDPRRIELLGELPSVPRVERPFWVCEQLEVALFEGLAGRLVALIGRKRDGRRRRSPLVAPSDPNLSFRQREILGFCRNYARRNGYPPSLREIAKMLGLASTSGLAYQLQDLQNLGYTLRDRPRTEP